MLEIKTEIFIQSLEDTGSEHPYEPSRAFIDLDCVSSCYDCNDGGIKICVNQDGVYKTTSFTLDQFAAIWKGEKPADPIKNEIDSLIEGLSNDKEN